MISFEGLVIEREEMDEESETKQQKFMWFIYVDMYCLNDDGNTTDACAIALLAALTNGERKWRMLLLTPKLAQIPQVRITAQGNVYIDATKPKKTLKILHYPIPLTFATIDEYVP